MGLEYNNILPRSILIRVRSSSNIEKKKASASPIH
jgi:hypothetical protein